ncbi:unnamed protein product [marine sediment metagenome]|uniref:Uncharacterized protein n=1 Tax=marine sediment metagenome TaxID=412755 RepID=X0SXM9_9ZZZZ
MTKQPLKGDFASIGEIYARSVAPKKRTDYSKGFKVANGQHITFPQLGMLMKRYGLNQHELGLLLDNVKKDTKTALPYMVKIAIEGVRLSNDQEQRGLGKFGSTDYELFLLGG